MRRLQMERWVGCSWLEPCWHIPVRKMSVEAPGEEDNEEEARAILSRPANNREELVFSVRKRR